MTEALRSLARRALVAAALLLSAHASAHAQDTTRVQRDTTKAKRDTTRAKPVVRDTTRLPAPAPPPTRGDSLRIRRDTVPAGQDTIRAKSDSAAKRPPQLPDSLVVPAKGPVDSLQADSARAQAAADSAARVAARKKAAADTIKAPLAHAEVPALPGIARAYRWDREAMFATGALTLTDLLREVPGFTEFRAGWLLSPHMGSYFGDFKPIRVFYDGIEMDNLDRRNNGLLDLSWIPIWTLEEVAVEQGAQELRVYLRSWRVRKTTPNTRVDIGTGDLETNLYRGFFGQRYPNGTALQVVAQQFSTTDPREAGDGDQLAVFGRFGLARRNWSVDAVLNRIGRTRAEQLRRDPTTGQVTKDLPTLPSLDATYMSWYTRAAYGDPDHGPWLQLLAGQMRFRESPESTTTLGGTIGGTVGGTIGGTTGTGTAADSLRGPRDTTTTRMQYIATGGLSRWGLRLSGTARYRALYNGSFFSPSGRAAFEHDRLAMSLYAERRGEDSTSRLDAAVQLTPLRFLSLAAYASRVNPQEQTHRPTETAIRGEAGIRLGRLWFSGGAMVRDTAVIRAPTVFDTAFQGAVEGRTLAAIGAIRGPVFKAVSVDISAMRFGSSGLMRPQLQLRAEAFASTSWLSKFPSGNFHIKAGVAYELRDAATFARADSTAPNGTAFLPSDAYRIVSTILEIRLLDAVLSWQFRNTVGFPYAEVPGLRMPRQLNFYGVRWDFFN